MDIYSYIKKDHEKVADLMQQVIDSRDPNERKALFDTIRIELILHLGSEEQTFYRAIEKASRAEAVEEQMDHAHHEHDEVRDYLVKLAGLRVDNEIWIETFGEFKHAVSHHVAEEEGDVWAKARKFLSSHDAAKLAHEMDAVKQEMRDNIDLPLGASKASKAILMPQSH